MRFWRLSKSKTHEGSGYVPEFMRGIDRERLRADPAYLDALAAQALREVRQRRPRPPIWDRLVSAFAFWALKRSLGRELSADLSASPAAGHFISYKDFVSAVIRQGVSDMDKALRHADTP